MSTRERWIVYPLLFLTLGIAMRDKIVPPLHFGGFGMKLEAGEVHVGRAICDRLEVGQATCKLLESGLSECRELIVDGPNGRPVIRAGADPKSRNGMIETYSAGGRPLVQLRSFDVGGVVLTFSRTGRVSFIGGIGQHPAKRGASSPPSTEQPPGKEKTEQPVEKEDQ